MSRHLEQCQVALFDDFASIANREDVVVDNAGIDAV
jgi:hypothetical protein